MTNPRDIAFRSLHDLGLAGWFGGTLMGVIGVNRAAGQATDPAERTRLSSVGWQAWNPVQAGFVAAHLAGSIGMLVVDRGRIAAQPGARAGTVVKTVLTAAALGTSAASAVLGSRIAEASPTPSATATEPLPATADEAASAQRALRPLQWATPALTGALVVLAAQQGEYQRTGSPLRARLGRGVTALAGTAATSGGLRRTAGRAAKQTARPGAVTKLVKASTVTKLAKAGAAKIT